MKFYNLICIKVNILALGPILTGIKPAILIVILAALWRLGQKAFQDRKLIWIALFVIVLVLTGTPEAIALFGGGILGMLWLVSKQDPNNSQRTLPILLLALSTSAKTATVSPTLFKLGLFFLKVGSILFGSGYVLFAFLEGDLVNQYGWLTSQQLLDAIAVGQFTPGPILSTATFIGYLILGIPGAIVATLGIFLPSFFFVVISHPFIAKIRQSKWASAFLDAVNASSVALIAVVTWKLAQTSLFPVTGGFSGNFFAFFIAISASIAVFRYRVNNGWIVVGSGILGWLFYQ
jgi:chromate transporter